MADGGSAGELNTWELSEGVSGRPPEEQAAGLLSEDWDPGLKVGHGNPEDAEHIRSLPFCRGQTLDVTSGPSSACPHTPGWPLSDGEHAKGWRCSAAWVRAAGPPDPGQGGPRSEEGLPSEPEWALRLV